MALNTGLELTMVAAHTVAFTTIVEATAVVARTVPFSRAVIVVKTVPFSKVTAAASLEATSFKGTGVTTDCYPVVAKTFIINTRI